MKLRLNSLQEGLQEIQAQLSGSEIGFTEKNLDSGISIDMQVNKGSREIQIKGQAHAALRYPCDRCAKQYTMQLDPHFEILLSHVESDSIALQDGVIPVTDTTMEVDISDQIRDALYLNIPMKKICKPDCKGLCDGCGANLNYEPCRCKKDEIDSRWAPLQKLIEKNSTED